MFFDRESRKAPKRRACTHTHKNFSADGNERGGRVAMREEVGLLWHRYGFQKTTKCIKKSGYSGKKKCELNKSPSET